MHRVIAPKIHYYGSSVILVSSLNPDETTNIAPISSCWWLGQSAVIGISSRGQTFDNIRNHSKDLVLNLASEDLVAHVDRLALTTGKYPVPDYKKAIGVEYVKDKFGRAGLTPGACDLVAPQRVFECKIALEVRVRNIHDVGPPDSHLVAVETEIIRTHCHESLLDEEKRHHINPDRWKPLIMNFLEFYAPGNTLRDSRLAKVF